MIFAFADDSTLSVYENPADAIRDFEGIDVESGVVRFYNDAGVYLEPRFITPNRTGKLLGLFGWVVSGSYELVENPSAGEDSFALALLETQTLNPNRWFASLDQVKS